ncbi:MAG: TolC family protein, partial [Marinirhabdus sp.]
MRNILIVFTIVCCSLSGFSQPGNPYSFTLQRAIDVAINSSYTALNARREIAKSLQRKWEAIAMGLPQINGTVNYNNNLRQPVTLIPGEFNGGPAGSFVPVTFGTKQNANVVATLNQLIFDGSYLVGLEAATVYLDFTENMAEKATLDLRKGIINAYGSVLLAEELVAVFEKNKATLEKNLSETREIYYNGLTEEENVEQLEITLLDVDTQLNNARRSVVIARQMFNVALGIPTEAQVTFEDNMGALAEHHIKLQYLEQALSVENNIDYRIAHNLTEQRSLEMKLEQSKALPRLSGFVNYATSANGNSFTFFDNNQKWFQSSVLGLSLDVPVFSSGLRDARTQRARIALDQAKTDLEETVQNVTLQLNTAKSNYQFSIERYENAKKNLALAERIENKNQVKFTEGLSTSFELRQAQRQLYSAQQQYFQSMLDLINAKAEIETVLNIPQL